MNRVIVFGAYGVFGSCVAKELAGRGVPLTVVGRDPAKAEALARALGPDCRRTAADLTRPESCRAAIKDHAVAVNCAGPFHGLGSALLDACLEAGCHYADIADDRGYVAVVRDHGERFRERGLAAVYGCSSLPGISGALALRAREGATAPVARVRVTLFIGNNNPKGLAAVSSLIAGLGRPFATPQGMLRGFGDREVVALPPPFGRRSVFNFQSPEYDLFPGLLGTKSISVKVGFELRPGNYLFALMARLGLSYGARTARLLEFPSRALRWLGCSGGAVMSELFLQDGTVRRCAIAGREGGQRMAALPCALVAHALARGEVRSIGAATAYEFLGAGPLIDGLVAAGYSLHADP